MELHYFQKGFNYSQDGPGNRLVYHLQGCNMCCPWCSNPEGMNPRTECQTVSVERIIEEIISCRPMFFDSGGVTFTGGEATLQLEAIIEIMKSVKRQGVSTALETNGTHKNLKAVSQYCDCLMIDLKHPESKVHKRVAGVPNEAVKRNIAEISKLREVHIRIPLIHGFNDTAEAVEGFIEFFSELSDSGGSFDVELLPYHEYGKEKWQKQGKEYEISDGFVQKQFVEAFKEQLINKKIKVINT